MTRTPLARHITCCSPPALSTEAFTALVPVCTALMVQWVDREHGVY